MIWLLLNGWWLLLATAALVVAGALISGIGGPVLLSTARRVPVAAWAALAAIIAVSLASGWLVRVGERRCQEAQEAAEAKADAKAASVAKKSNEAATEARTIIRKESSDAQAEARVIVRSLPAACPAQPDRLRELGDAAVQGARDGVLPAPGR